MSEDKRAYSTDTQFLLGVYNDAIRHTNHLWSAALFLILIYFSASFSNIDEGQMIWFMDASFAKTAMLIALAGANMAYCNSHIVQYQIGRFWAKESENDKILQIAPVSSFNRLYPTLGFIRESKKIKCAPKIYSMVKLFFDILLCGVPFLCLLFGVVSLSFAEQYPFILKVALAFLTLLSFVFTTSLWRHALGWAEKEGVAKAS